jgi:hypothetical protein
MIFRNAGRSSLPDLGQLPHENCRVDISLGFVTVMVHGENATLTLGFLF